MGRGEQRSRKRRGVGKRVEEIEDKIRERKREKEGRMGGEEGRKGRK